MTVNVDQTANIADLESNRQRLIETLQPVLKRFEAAFGFASSELDERLATGQVEDTLEICDWYVAWHSFTAATDGRSPRLE